MTSLLGSVRRERAAGQLALSVRLARRQIAQRYRETIFGRLWSLLNPLVMLGIYWFVFSEVFDSRWSGPGEDRHYALLIFSGLVLFNMYAEIVNGSTTLVQNNALLIKRTTVSARVIPISAALASLFTLMLNFIPFFVMYLVLERELPPATALLFPLIVVPLLMMSLALALLFASVSAYFRDLQQVIPLINTAILFVSPIFFPASRLPPGMQDVSSWVSPLVAPLEASKAVLFIGVVPDLGPMIWYSVVAVTLLAIGWQVYGVAARGFGDVV
jgi:lipopolysaccharide transport system permease protein